ncbi:MAG: DUF899 domain-containing protein [Proteobacteria bacterium]|nr:DUF899 domain-containing protein [Pseudomonadota bacterium]
MQSHRIVSRDEWIAARKELLVREKEFTKARDALSARRRELPWVRVDKDYLFEGPNGSETLSDLSDGRGQLIVYHFMYGPDWEEGCPSCSYLSDHFDGAIMHLKQRDVTLVAASRAPLEKLEAYKKRMGWRFKWVSSLGSDFNFDYHASFDADDLAKGEVYYNYRNTAFPSSEAPGLSVFRKDESGEIFHTYSTYARGLDMLIGAYNFLDLVPKGRDEADLPFTMGWVRRHDRYED